MYFGEHLSAVLPLHCVISKGSTAERGLPYAFVIQLNKKCEGPLRPAEAEFSPASKPNRDTSPFIRLTVTLRGVLLPHCPAQEAQPSIQCAAMPTCNTLCSKCEVIIHFHLSGTPKLVPH